MHLCFSVRVWRFVPLLEHHLRSIPINNFNVFIQVCFSTLIKESSLIFETCQGFVAHERLINFQWFWATAQALLRQGPHLDFTVDTLVLRGLLRSSSHLSQSQIIFHVPPEKECPFEFIIFLHYTGEQFLSPFPDLCFSLISTHGLVRSVKCGVWLTRISESSANHYRESQALRDRGCAVSIRFGDTCSVSGVGFMGRYEAPLSISCNLLSEEERCTEWSTLAVMHADIMQTLRRVS